MVSADSSLVAKEHRPQDNISSSKKRDGTVVLLNAALEKVTANFVNPKCFILDQEYWIQTRKSSGSDPNYFKYVIKL